MSHTGLGRLPDNLGLTRSVQEEVDVTWTTQAVSEASLDAQGFELPEQPQFVRPLVTEDDLLTENTRNFSILFARVLAWHNYAKTCYARLRGKLLELENKKDRISFLMRREARADVKEKKMSAKELEENIELDPVFSRLKLAAQEVEQQKLLMDAFCESLERDLRTVSRQVEINRQELEGENIKNNLPRRGRTPTQEDNKYGVRRPREYQDP